MIEDNKNNDTKEELKTSSDGDDMDNQQANENEDLNKEVNIGSSESDNKTEKKLDEVNQETPNKNLENENKVFEDSVEKENKTKNKDTEQKEEKDDDPNMKWYVVGAASSFEEKAVKSIQDNARKASLSHFFLIFKFQNKR